MTYKKIKALIMYSSSKQLIFFKNEYQRPNSSRDFIVVQLKFRFTSLS